jgi:MEMO1 family protein
LFILPGTSIATSIDKLNIVSDIVPHHLLAEEIVENFFSYISSQGKPETIVILSPDHFQSGILTESNSFITIALNSNEKEFNNLKGVTVLLPYIKKYFPETNILPILIPADITKEKIEQLVKTIDENTLLNAIVVGSVDFSHYLPSQAADFHDTKSIRVLLNFEEDNFENLEVKTLGSNLYS